MMIMVFGAGSNLPSKIQGFRTIYQGSFIRHLLISQLRIKYVADIRIYDRPSHTITSTNTPRLPLSASTNLTLPKSASQVTLRRHLMIVKRDPSDDDVDKNTPADLICGELKCGNVDAGSGTVIRIITSSVIQYPQIHKHRRWYWYCHLRDYLFFECYNIHK